jgi:hypothetical protein
MGYYKWFGLLGLGQKTSLGWPIWVNLLYNPKTAWVLNPIQIPKLINPKNLLVVGFLMAKL